MADQDVPSAGGISRRNVLGGGIAASLIPLASMSPAASILSSEERLMFRDANSLDELDRFGDPQPIAGVVERWRKLPPVETLEWHAIDVPWNHAVGTQQEGLNALLDAMPPLNKVVRTPHRILPADTPYWYRADMSLPTPCVIRIDADDGAHLWVNGTRIHAANDVFAVPKQADARVDLVVRVLNKAMYGGLEHVYWTDSATYDTTSKQNTLRDRLDRAVVKLRLLVEPPKSAVRAGLLATKEPTETNVAAFERTMASFPLATIAPSIRTASPESAVVVWETDVPCIPALRYGDDKRSARIDSDGRFHRATLTGLKPERTVEYEIEGHPASRFKALPDTSDFVFTVWGDPHIGGSRFRQNVSALIHEPAAFTVGVGDQVVDASRKQPWEEFFAIGAPLFASTPAFFIGGNHDYDGCFEDLVSVYHNRYARLNEKPWYSWRVGEAFFVALDPNVQFPTGIDEGSEQHRFLLRELASGPCRTAKWRFLFIHQPPFSQGWTDYEGDLQIRKLLEPLIEEHRIHFVVSGHTHDYERLTRSYGDHRCTFLIVGGAGGGLEDGPLTPQPAMETVQRRHHYGRFRVTADRVEFESVATDTLILDRWVVTG